MTREERARIAYTAYRKQFIELHVAHLAVWEGLEPWEQTVWCRVIDALDASAKGE